MTGRFDPNPPSPRPGELLLWGLAVALGVGAFEAARSPALTDLRALGAAPVLSTLAIVLAWHAAFGVALGLSAAVFARVLGAGLWRARLAWALPLAGVMALLAERLVRPALFGRPRVIEVVVISIVVLMSLGTSLGTLEVVSRIAAHVRVAPQHVRRAGLLLLAAGALVLSAPYFRGAAGRATTSRPNVVLVSLDTVRADHLGVYGYERPTAPALARLAEEGVVFESAWAPEPWTLPSHMTMMTSLFPLTHGARTASSRLAPERTTLAEHLGAAGYQTVAFVASGPKSWVGGERGFADGFDLYHHPPHRSLLTLDTSLLGLWKRLTWPPTGSAAGATAAAESYIGLWADEPFFLFLHFYDAHSDFHSLPYEAPPELVEEVAGRSRGDFSGCDEQKRCASSFLKTFGACAGERREIDPATLRDVIDHYDAGIRVVDDALGRVVTALEQRGLLDRTIVIVTSDHGEEFLEHGRFLHTQLRPELLRVPLVLRLPGGTAAGLRSQTPVSHADLLPTVLDLLGLERGDELEGVSLVPLLRGEALPQRALFFSSTDQSGSGRTLEVGVLDAGRQLVRRVNRRCEAEGNAQALLALGVEKPGGGRGTVAVAPDDSAYAPLIRLLDSWQAKAEASAARRPTHAVPLDDEERKRLEALGYLSH